VSPEDVEKCTERFSKAKAVSSILRHVAELLKYETDEQLEELYSKTAWYFEEKHKSKAASYDIFKQAVIEPSLLDECNLDENTKNVLLTNIKRKLTSQAMKIRADIECACYGYEGIDAVKKALLAGLELSTEEIPIKINLIAPPVYVITTSTPEKADGLKALEVCIQKIETTIKSLDGHFAIQMAVSITIKCIFNSILIIVL
jgi:translation initiation factor 2 subunit 1